MAAYREIIIGDIFSKAQQTEQTNELAHTFRKLGHVFEKKVKTWWDIPSFEQLFQKNVFLDALDGMCPRMMDSWMTSP